MKILKELVALIRSPFARLFNRLWAILYIIFCKDFVLVVQDEKITEYITNAEALKAFDMINIVHDHYLDAIVSEVIPIVEIKETESLTNPNNN
jgi:hypothetical protein